VSKREHQELRELRQKAPADAVSIELEVPFHDLDPLFVAWHGWYYKYFEIARTALFRAHRIDVRDMIPMNLGFYVVETRARHIRPLRYGERFRVAAWFTEHESRVGIAYEVTSVAEGHRIARGKTTLVTTLRKKHGPGEDEMLFETPAVLVERILGPRIAVEGARVPGAVAASVESA
jgi:acyl-CoA thioester hydrolase